MRRLTLLLVACVVLTAGAAFAAVDKDGPVDKISPELLALYDAYVAAQRHGGPFIPTDPLVRIVDGRVIVDATASGNVGALETDLKALGMRETVSAGAEVLGALRVSATPAPAQLAAPRVQ